MQVAALAAPPGCYNTRIAGREFVTCGWPGSTTPGDQWRIQPNYGEDNVMSGDEFPSGVVLRIHFTDGHTVSYTWNSIKYVELGKSSEAESTGLVTTPRTNRPGIIATPRPPRPAPPEYEGEEEDAPNRYDAFRRAVGEVQSDPAD